MMMIIVFAFIFPIFPSRATPVTSPSDPYYIFDLLYHMILPLVTLVLVGFGAWAYTVRYYVINIFNEDFIAAKRAQGISHRKITYSHALKNAAPPTFTAIAISLSSSPIQQARNLRDEYGGIPTNLEPRCPGDSRLS